MNLSIVIIGDEILLGGVTDTNSGLIARTFSASGWDVKSVRTVGDNEADIRSAVEASLAESELVVTTGGLGPTRDDITKGLLRDIFGGGLVLHQPSADNVDRIFAERGLTMNELTRGQAMIPSSCEVIVNRLGTAPIMWFERDDRVLVAMPGVPYETRGMLPEVAEKVAEFFHPSLLVRHREFTVVGISESLLAEHLAPFENELPAGYKLAYLPSPGYILMRLDAHFENAAGADEQFNGFCDMLVGFLGENFVGYGRQTPAELVLKLCRDRGFTLASAESCTGGNISHSITEIAGCSDVFVGSVVSYSNEVKIGVLGVSPETLANDGAVSEATVRQMVEGVRRATGADCAVATSGVAGPGGGSPEKPVGTVWIASATPAGVVARLYHFGGDRSAVIERATAAALNQLAAML